MKLKNLGIFMLCVTMLVGMSGSVRAWADLLSVEATYEFFGSDGLSKGIAVLYANFDYEEPDYVRVVKSYTGHFVETPYEVDTLSVEESGQPNQHAYVSAEFEFRLYGYIISQATIGVGCDVYGVIY